MTIQFDHITEARRPDIVVFEKESNKAIIVDIASPWYHRVYDKKSEKGGEIPRSEASGRLENYGVLDVWK